jgi:Flp pilus assembly protein TadB
MLFGAAAGAGVLLVALALRPRRQPLQGALRRLHDPPVPRDRHGRLAGLAHTIVTTHGFGAVRAADLVIVERTPQQHALRKVLATVSLAALAPAGVALARLSGVDAPALPALLATIALAAVGQVVPDVEVRGLAAERRATFTDALSGYLDVTAVLLAGGAGTETALRTAADLGGGWPHRQLRSALDRCRLTGQTPWEAFAELADRLDITELSQLATSLALAGEHGARIRRTLTERARTLRVQRLAEVEARARAATEQMSVPVALLAVAFMLFVGFPAVWVVLGEL